MCYFSEHLLIFSLFSDQTSSTEKQKMAKELLKYLYDEAFPSNTRVQQMPVLQQRTQLHNLIGKDSWTLFKVLRPNTGTSFLTTNPKLWSQNSDYLKVKAIIKAIPVVNDVSE